MKRKIKVIANSLLAVIVALLLVNCTSHPQWMRSSTDRRTETFRSNGERIYFSSTSDRFELPEGIHRSFLPSHSPELQPAERLWTLTNEPIANRCFESLDEVEEVLFQRCRQILARPNFVGGLTNFYWWSELGA